MSEPVGNGPRGMDIPGNSLKKRAPEQPKEEDKAPQEKIVVGKVVTRRQPWFKRAARSMIADDVQNIREYMIVDVLVPAAKNLIRDLVVGGLDRSLFGTTRNAGRRVGANMGGAREPLRTRYDRMADGDRGEPRRALSRESRARHDFDDILLDDRAEAIEVVEALIERVARYGVATVTDLYDALGVTGSFADRSWGWTNLDTADVRQSGRVWLLDLPAPQPLR